MKKEKETFRSTKTKCYRDFEYQIDIRNVQYSSLLAAQTDWLRQTDGQTDGQTDNCPLARVLDDHIMNSVAIPPAHAIQLLYSGHEQHQQHQQPPHIYFSMNSTTDVFHLGTESNTWKTEGNAKYNTTHIQ